MSAGWLTDLTKWLWDALKAFFAALVDFFNDLFVLVLDQICDAMLYVLSLLGLPDFMKDNSIGGMLGNAGSTILWFAELFQIGPSMVMIGVAIIFYLLRRILTVGIW